MITRIFNYTTTDITNSIKYLLNKAALSFEVQQQAILITQHDQDKISSIYDWIKTNVHYVSDAIIAERDIEVFISPVKMVENYNLGLRLDGDCDDHALLATAFYRSIGLKSNVVIIDSIGQGLDHAYSQVFSEKLQDWIDVDTTSKYPLGWILPYNKKIIVE